MKNKSHPKVTLKWSRVGSDLLLSEFKYWLEILPDSHD